MTRVHWTADAATTLRLPGATPALPSSASHPHELVEVGDGRDLRDGAQSVCSLCIAATGSLPSASSRTSFVSLRLANVVRQVDLTRCSPSRRGYQLLPAELGMHSCNARSCSLHTPDARKARPLRHAIDEVIVALVGGRQERVDDVAMRQPGRALGGARRKQPGRIRFPPHLCHRERSLGPI